MTGYAEFVNKLNDELNSFLYIPKEVWKETALKNVNGLAGEELRRTINLETRREYGAFFTDSLLAKKVLELLTPIFTINSIIYDPACGAGNLLISVSDYIQESNINFKCNSQLLGTDLHEEFIRATELRLRTNFLLKQPTHSDKVFNSQLKKKYSVVKADGLIKNKFFAKATHIFVNPPFNQIIPKENLSWSKGKVSAAALFIDKIIQFSNPGVSIIAILPDVLRSGTRYEKWRAMVEKECIIEKTELLGQFDKYADVDIYAVKMTKRIKSVSDIVKVKSTTRKNSQHNQTLSDLFDICVGPVVDNRDEEEGPSRPYLVSRGLEGWSIQKAIKRMRKHGGKEFNGPFVVIKRTSRMGDSQRAIATIINVSVPVFIDNHLIVLIPKSKTLRDCKLALKNLKDKRTDEWLNNKIRCRHLTVKVVSEIPVWN
jgi:N-6 DNA Methylase